MKFYVQVDGQCQQLHIGLSSIFYHYIFGHLPIPANPMPFFCHWGSLYLAQNVFKINDNGYSMCWKIRTLTLLSNQLRVVLSWSHRFGTNPAIGMNFGLSPSYYIMELRVSLPETNCSNFFCSSTFIPCTTCQKWVIVSLSASKPLSYSVDDSYEDYHYIYRIFSPKREEWDHKKEEPTNLYLYMASS